jgi:replication initiation and membrane attachment protein DnaB
MASLNKPILNSLPHNIADLPLTQWNKGVFDLELLKQRLVSNVTSAQPTKSVFDLELLKKRLVSNMTSAHPAEKQLQQGTYAGTQLALTEIFTRIEQR